MAATYLTVGSRFRPYSFEEYVQPLNMYKEEYQRQEDLYNTYAETAGLIGADLNPTLDKDILDNTYNPYMEALNAGADILATEGLTPGGRKQLQELRRRFGREITPIKMASEARAKARENWDKMLAQDKTLMTNANPYYQGISAYMNGASPDTTYVSGNELYSRGQALSKAMSNVLRDVPSEEALVLQDQYWRIVQTKGFNSEEMLGFLNGVIDAAPELSNQVNRILQSSGIFNEGFTPADWKRAKQYIIEGMASGMSGDTKVDYMQNQNFMSDYEKWKKAHSDDPKPNEYPSQYRTASYQRIGSLYEQSLEDLAQFENFSPDKVLHVRDYNREYTVGSRTEATDIMQDYNSRVSDFENEFKENLGFDFPGDKSSKIIRNDDGTSIEIYKNNDGTFTVRRREARTMSNPGMKPAEKDQQLTDLYNQYYREYMKLQAEGDFLKSSGIEETAFSDKELEKMRERYGIPENTDITDYADMIRNNPEAKVENRDYVVVDAEGDTGRKYRDALTSKMFNHLVSQNPGVKIKNIGAQSVPTRGSGVYILDENFEHDKKVKNINELFTFGDDGTINNVNNYKFTPQSLSNGNMVVTVVKDGKVINAEIPLEYFGNEIAAVLYDVNPDTGISYKDSIDYYIKKGDWNSATSLTLDISNLIAPLVNYNSQTVQGETKNID